MTEIPGLPVAILKADPAEALSLREHNSHITPGYHMNKVSHLSKAEQPVDPHTSRSGTRAAR